MPSLWHSRADGHLRWAGVGGLLVSPDAVAPPVLTSGKLNRKPLAREVFIASRRRAEGGCCVPSDLSACVAESACCSGRAWLQE